MWMLCYSPSLIGRIHHHILLFLPSDKHTYIHIYVCMSVYALVYLQPYMHNLHSNEWPTDIIKIFVKKGGGI